MHVYDRRLARHSVEGSLNELETHLTLSLGIPLLTVVLIPKVRIP